jgi:5-carboxymethyl-2-hydroxymuconate isomerase
MEEDVPNLVMEYADPVAERVNVPGLLEDLHQILLTCGLFEPDSVKCRSYPCHTWLVGTEGDLNTFIHIELSMLSGRTTEQKRELARSLISMLEQHASTINSLTVDVRDMDRDSFIKVSC